MTRKVRRSSRLVRAVLESVLPALRGNEAAESEAAMERKPKIGMHVVVFDEVGLRHEGLITADWGTTDEFATVNVLFCASDDTKQDNYGRQIERLSSCAHRSRTNAPGRFWIYPEEEQVA